MAASPPDVVLGQGSLGTLIAAALAGSDRPVHVVSRRAETPEEVELTAVGRGTSRRTRVQLTPKVPEEARLVVVATRSDDALERARQAQPALVDEGAIVPLQNGLTGLLLAEELGAERVAPAVVGFNAHLEGEARAEITSPGTITLGAMADEARPGAEAFAAAVREPVRAELTDNPRGAVWSKWCVSCAINGLAVVAGTGVGTITRERVGREALVSIVTECCRLAEAENVELERVAGPLAPDTLAGNATSGLGGAFRRGVTWLIGRRYADVTPSSIEALRDGRDPELDALNREAVERGESLDVPTPWNRATLEVAREVAGGDREPAMGNLEDVRRLATGAA